MAEEQKMIERKKTSEWIRPPLAMWNLFLRKPSTELLDPLDCPRCGNKISGRAQYHHAPQYCENCNSRIEWKIRYRAVNLNDLDYVCEKCGKQMIQMEEPNQTWVMCSGCRFCQGKYEYGVSQSLS